MNKQKLREMISNLISESNVQTKVSGIDFTIFYMNNRFVVIPKDSTQRDLVSSIEQEGKIEALKNNMEKFLTKKIGMKVESDFAYRGAGLGFKFDDTNILRKLK